jgi:hypothetical protein
MYTREPEGGIGAVKPGMTFTGVLSAAHVKETYFPSYLLSDSLEFPARLK